MPARYRCGMSVARRMESSSARRHVTAALQLVTCASGIALFLTADWYALQRFYAEALTLALRAVGAEAIIDRNLVVLIPGRERGIWITPGCTFTDFFLSLVPFCLTFSRIKRDLLVFVGLGITVSVLNFLRLSIVMYCYYKGASWFWVHDVPTYGVWVLASFSCLVSWLRTCGLPLLPNHMIQHTSA